jgi:hypothetical protein
MLMASPHPPQIKAKLKNPNIDQTAEEHRRNMLCERATGRQLINVTIRPPSPQTISEDEGADTRAVTRPNVVANCPAMTNTGTQKMKARRQADAAHID